MFGRHIWGLLLLRAIATTKKNTELKERANTWNHRDTLTPSISPVFIASRHCSSRFFFKFHFCFLFKAPKEENWPNDAAGDDLTAGFGLGLGLDSLLSSAASSFSSSINQLYGLKNDRTSAQTAEVYLVLLVRKCTRASHRCNWWLSGRGRPEQEHSPVS